MVGGLKEPQERSTTLCPAPPAILQSEMPNLGNLFKDNIRGNIGF